MTRIIAKDLSVGHDDLVVEHVNLNLDSGIYFLAGLNGTGKTTLLLTLAGLLSPKSGIVQVNTADIGYFPDNPSFGQYLTVHEFLFALARFQKTSSEKRLEQMIDVWGIRTLLCYSPDRLSAGEKRRVQLARFFSLPRNILLMDEPFNNLDLHYCHTLYELLHREPQGVVIFTQHSLGISVRNLRGIFFLRGRTLTSASPENGSLLCRAAEDTFGGQFVLRDQWLLPVTEHT